MNFPSYFLLATWQKRKSTRFDVDYNIITPNHVCCLVKKKSSHK